ncbi:MAG: HAD family hydrolase [Candidatus Woesearchaeota archaeon]
MYHLVAFDMDGVIFKHRNFWLELHKALGTYEEGKALTQKYLKTDYKKLVEEVPGRLWKGKDAQPYHDLIKSLEYLPHVPETLKELKRRGYKTAIISSGPKHAALRVQEECGLDHFFTHDLKIGPDGKFTGEYDHDGNHHDKTKQLKEFAEETNCTLHEMVFVGHDHNDTTALKAAGLGVAYNPEDDDVKAAADETITDLKELLPLLDT